MNVEQSYPELYDHLRHIYLMEKHLVEALSAFSNMVSDAELRELICLHAGRAVDHRARLYAAFASHGVLFQDEMGDSLHYLITGESMELANVRDHATRDLLVAAHCKRIGDGGIHIYSVAACLARKSELNAAWNMLAMFCADQEDIISRLDDICVRLLDEHAFRNGGAERKLA